MNRIFKRIVLAAILIGAGTAPAAAQTGSAIEDPSRVRVTRQQLEELLAQLEAAANSGGYSSAARDRARDEARLVRQRLEEGDFQVGDRVVLWVRNEEVLTDTFTVAAGRMLPLPLGESVPLQGVLRSELEGHLRDHLSRYIRDPEVRAESLLRVTVAGNVTQPGFYVVRAEALIGDVLMTAGGPTQDADVTKLYIERGGRTIWEGAGLEEAIAQGRTLDQLSIRAGDTIILPERSQTGGIGRTLLYIVPPVVSLLVAISALAR